MNELLKQRLEVAVVGFNLTVMGYMLLRWSLGMQLNWNWYMQQALFGAGWGLVVATIAFVVVGKMQK